MLFFISLLQEAQGHFEEVSLPTVYLLKMTPVKAKDVSVVLDVYH